MMPSVCFFIRDLATPQIARHEIAEIETGGAGADERAKGLSAHVLELMEQFQPSEYEVFLESFDSKTSLYGAWPELLPTKRSE